MVGIPFRFGVFPRRGPGGWIGPLITCGLIWAATATHADELPNAAPRDVGLSPRTLARIRPELQKLVDGAKLPGAMTVVVRQGRVAFSEAVGFRDVGAKQPLAADTILRIYSMTKPVTSAAALMLVDDGKLQLNDPVSKYIPQLKDLRVLVVSADGKESHEPAEREITIRDLLRHTSGFAYGTTLGITRVDDLYRKSQLLDHHKPLDEMMHNLSRLPLVYQPGTRFNYSISLHVLGRVIEVVSGEGLDAFFSRRLFKPLDMRDTGFQVPADKQARFAKLYGPGLFGGLSTLDNPRTSRFTKPPKLLSGAGGLVSTARDYTRFCQMILNRGRWDGKQLLRPETVRLMTTNQLPESMLPISIGPIQRKGLGFGLGFSVRVARDDRTDPSAPRGEFGWGGAACTHVWFSPKDELFVLVLSQYMPYSYRLETLVKPIVYQAVERH